MSTTASSYNSIGGFSVGIPPIQIADANGNIVTNIFAGNGNVFTNLLYANSYSYGNGQPIFNNAGFNIKTVTAGITATGNSQLTATLLTRSVNEVTTVTGASGVILPSTIIGMNLIIINSTIIQLLVYPPVGSTFQETTTNTPITMNSNQILNFVATSNTQWYYY